MHFFKYILLIFSCLILIKTGFFKITINSKNAISKITAQLAFINLFSIFFNILFLDRDLEVRTALEDRIKQNSAI